MLVEHWIIGIWWSIGTLERRSVSPGMPVLVFSVDMLDLSLAFWP